MILHHFLRVMTKKSLCLPAECVDYGAVFTSAKKKYRHLDFYLAYRAAVSFAKSAYLLLLLGLT